MSARLAVLCGMLLLAQAAGAQTPTITTVVGNGPNNVAALNANLAYPVSITQDKLGNFYIAVENDSRIYKISSGGTLTIFAGTGGFDYTGDGGPATAAELNGPLGVTVDSSGNVFIADTNNHVIRRVDATTSIITTVAGNFSMGGGFSGDGGSATSAQLYYPSNVRVDGAGNIFIADTQNQVIREVLAANGQIQTIAGNPQTAGSSGDFGPATSAELNYPYDLFLDGFGNVFIADVDNYAIREYVAANQTLRTIAGMLGGPPGFSGDGGAATSALLSIPYGIALDSSGNIFISDAGNAVVREIAASTGIIQTVAGSHGNFGYTGDGGPATSATLEFPEGLYVDGSGNLFIVDSNNLVIRQVFASTGNIQTFAGNGFYHYGGDGGPAFSAAIDGPGSVVSDAAGNLYIADINNNVVRKVDAATGTISTVAGNAMLGCGFNGNGSPATNFQLCSPIGVALDSSGNLFIADSNNDIVREVLASTGGIVTVAGVPNSGSICETGSDSIGDGCPATSAGLDFPEGVAVDSAGNLFIADIYNQVIRKVDAATGIIQSVAGTPGTCGFSGDGGPATSSQLCYPSDVAVDASGNLFIADTQNGLLREVLASTGIIQTIAGLPESSGYSGDGGPATSAQTSGPVGVAVDAAGNVFFSDCGGLVTEAECNFVVREVSGGIIQTVAGSGAEGFSGDGGPATLAELDYPGGLRVDPAGNLLIGDYYNDRIRQVTGLGGPAQMPSFSASPNPLDFGNQAENTTNSLPLTISNGGTGPLVISGLSVPESDFGYADGAGTCGQLPITVNADSSCTLQFTFSPTVLGMESVTATIFDNATGNPHSVTLKGNGTPPPAPAVKFSPAALAFGVVPVGTTSGPMAVTLTNTGSASLFVDFASIGGTNAQDFSISGDTCSDSTVDINATCMVMVTFKPSVATPESASLIFTDNAANSPQSVPLAGGGPGFTLTAPASPSGGDGSTLTLQAGDTAIYTLVLVCTPGVSGTVTLSYASPLPPNTILTITPAMVTCPATGAVTISVKLQTNCTGQLVRPRAPEWPSPMGKIPVPFVGMCMGALALLALCAQWLLRRRPVRLAPAIAVLLLVALALGAAACVNNNPPAIPGAPKTPAGTYPLTIVGTGPTGAQLSLGLIVRVI